MMFFYFLKIIFDISTSKRSKKYKPHSILAKKKKKKKFKFGGNAGTNAVPNVPYIDSLQPQTLADQMDSSSKS
jgi:hypothetical protein